MELKIVQDIFKLVIGQTVTKRNLFDLIQYSKIESSPFWSGTDYIIRNTPQQGINWIGAQPNILAVIIKTKPGSYNEDGWSDNKKTFYNYSFKSKKGTISFTEMANDVLIKQPQFLYPILLFTDCTGGWKFEGSFNVFEIKNKFVILSRRQYSNLSFLSVKEDLEHYEGSRKYINHLMVERNHKVVKFLKETQAWICDICDEDFNLKYGIKYIEAHHKVPISIYFKTHKVNASDLVLLCPNCHKAVHLYMKRDGIEYAQIKALISRH